MNSASDTLNKTTVIWNKTADINNSATDIWNKIKDMCKIIRLKISRKNNLKQEINISIKFAFLLKQFEEFIDSYNKYR